MRSKGEVQAETNTVLAECKICIISRYESKLVKLGEKKPEYGNNIPLRKGFGELDKVCGYLDKFKLDSKDIISHYAVYNDGTVVVTHAFLEGKKEVLTGKCTRYITLKEAQRIQQFYKPKDDRDEEVRQEFSKYKQEYRNIILKNSDTLSSSIKKRIAYSEEKDNFQQCNRSSIKSATIEHDASATESPSQVLSEQRPITVPMASSCCVII